MVPRPDPIQLAEQLHHYQEAFEISSEVARSDIVRRDQFMKATNSAPLTLKHGDLDHFDTGEEANKMLDMYDQELAREPKCYDECVSPMFSGWLSDSRHLVWLSTTDVLRLLGLLALPLPQDPSGNQ